MKTDEKVLCQEPFICFERVGLTIGQVWFPNTGCYIDEQKLLDLKRYVECLQSDIFIRVDEAEYGVIEMVMNPHMAHGEKTLNMVLDVIVRALRASCPHDQTYDPDFRVFPGLIPETTSENVILH